MACIACKFRFPHPNCVRHGSLLELDLIRFLVYYLMSLRQISSSLLMKTKIWINTLGNFEILPETAFMD
jgi:hypothetical protein